MPLTSRAPTAPRKLARATKFLLDVLPLSRPTTFCDVGANPINEPPYQRLLQAGGCRVVGFEPNPDAFAELEKAKGSNETYFPLAVGDGKSHVLHLYKHSGFSSIFLPHLPGLNAVGAQGWGTLDRDVEMKTVALDKIKDLPPFDCLKIDIQGGEELVFRNGRKVMADAVAVIVEMRWMQLYEGEPMAAGIDAELRAQGFMMHKFLFNKSKMLGNSQARRLRGMNADQLIDGDAVYLRHPGKLDALSDDQLGHMALIGGAVIDSHSLTVAALDELVRRGRIDASAPARYVDALPAELRAPAPDPAERAARRSARRAARADKPKSGEDEASGHKASDAA